MVNFKKKLNFKGKIFLVLTFIGFASILINVINYENYFEVTINEFSNTCRLKTSNWVVNYTIAIDDTKQDGWLNWEEAILMFPGCSGNGSWNNPYILENVTITNGKWIIIRNSQVPFIIRNCIVYNSSREGRIAGINLSHTDNGQIIDNDCSNGNLWGISVAWCENNTLSGNTLNKNDEYGLLLYDSDHNIVSGNMMNYNEQYGLMLYRADYNHIEGNEFIYNHQGCIAEYYGCTGNVIINNKCRHDFTKLFFSPSGILMLVGVISLPIAIVGFWFWYKRSISIENER